MLRGLLDLTSSQNGAVVKIWKILRTSSSLSSSFAEMSGLRSLQLLLFYLCSLSRPSSSSIYPLIGSPALLSPQTPVPTIVLPPVSHPRRSVLLPVVSRRQTGPIDLTDEKEPTCAELKTIWRKMRRMARQMEMTNEIPKVPDPFVSNAYNYKPKYPDANPYSLPKSSNFKVFQAVNNNNRHLNDYQKPIQFSRNFGKIIRDPDEHRFYKVKNKLSGGPGLVKGPVQLGFDEFDDEYSNPSGLRNHGRVPGRFSNNPLPEEALGVYGTVVRTPEERAKFRSVSRDRPDAGFRSRMRGVERRPLIRVPFRASKPHGAYHYGSVVTHLPPERAAGPNGRFVSVTSPSMYRSHPMGGFAEFPTEVGQRSSNAPARVERIDKIVGAAKQKNSCLRVHTKTCKTDVDCFCVGKPKLFCGGNRCRPRFKAQKYEQTPNWGRSLFVNPDYDNYVKYDFKQDPLWPAPF